MIQERVKTPLMMLETIMSLSGCFYVGKGVDVEGSNNRGGRCY